MFWDKKVADERRALDRYESSARAVRTWFIAYGIGVPAVLIANDAALNRLIQSGWMPSAMGLFLAGVLVQIVAEVLRKRAFIFDWLVRSAEADARSTNEAEDRFGRSLLVGIGYHLSGTGSDFVTLGFFVSATIIVGLVLCSPSAVHLPTSMPASMPAVAP